MKPRLICFFVMSLSVQSAMSADECSRTIAVTLEAKSPVPTKTNLRLKVEIDGKAVQAADYSASKQLERILIVVDASGSMNAWRTAVSEPNRWPAELDLANGLLAGIPSTVPVGLLVFGDGTLHRFPITTDHKEIAAALDSLRSFVPHGKTDFSSTTEHAKAMFNGRHVGDVMVVLTDGVDNDPTGVRKIADQLNREGIRLAGVILAANRVHLQELFIDAAKATGGDVMSVATDFSDPKKMREAGQSLAARIVDFYEVVIRFATSSNRPPRLRLGVQDPPLVNAHYPATIPSCSEMGAEAQ